MTTSDTAAPARGKILDAVAAVAVIGFGAAIWVGSSGFPTIAVEGQISPSFWPRVVSGLLVGLGALLLVLALLGRTTPVEAEAANRAQAAPLALVLGLLVAYLISWSLVGFLPATLVAFLLLGKVLGTVAWWRAALWSLVLTLVVWGLFGQLLRVPL
jgi:putative tricarboxylic transport membrane protein